MVNGPDFGVFVQVRGLQSMTHGVVRCGQRSTFVQVRGLERLTTGWSSHTNRPPERLWGWQNLSTERMFPVMMELHASKVDNERLRETVAEYEGSINWGTSCLNCASLLDQNYADYVRAERAEKTLAAVRKAALEDAALDHAHCLRNVIKALGGVS